ncbi:prolyl-tRNA synthetase associated domain-containing protein [Novispirillum itersonii]|uniref:Ala-tRNA(Pro) deacylase n=1 Tax=Novispirillum itersonii TaxID=189 RepID=A0A7W9ZIS5_NOVIT|nr:prolyl-tRNA synthetase associated domain-containing protein [Novispirillum itersonii]MBB6211970.1 Ala-tRNA(Pro) deacylase [Novispirillum itersonii]
MSNPAAETAASPLVLSPHHASRAALMTFLDGLNIRTSTVDHPPIMTVEDGHQFWADIPGVHCKNLFLRDAKKQTWLVVAPIDRQIDLKTLPDRIGSKRLSFGSAERLVDMLGVFPGSVTPFSLINDRAAQAVNVVLDQWMMDQPILNYHPLENTATTSISNTDLLTFVRACGHAPQIATLA